MSNEGLAILAQAGDGKALLELWGQVHRMVYKEAAKWAAYGGGGATLEDLVQAGFVALLRAVDGYDGTRGTKFTTFLFAYLRAEFAIATNRQTTRTQRDPLQTAASLDAPLTDNDGDPLTFAAIIPDPAAAEQIEGVGIRLAVAAVLAELPEEQQRAVRGKYWHDLPVDSKAHAAALRYLRHPARSQRLAAYL